MTGDTPLFDAVAGFVARLSVIIDPPAKAD